MTIADILTACRVTFQRKINMGPSISGGEIRADFYVDPTPRFPSGLVIEPNYQSVPGSVDRKLAYLWANIYEDCYSCPVVILLMGGAQSAGIVDWLRRKVDGWRLVAVLDEKEFSTWIKRYL